MREPGLPPVHELTVVDASNGHDFGCRIAPTLRDAMALTGPHDTAVGEGEIPSWRA